jgi:hypothetical protein
MTDKAAEDFTPPVAQGLPAGTLEAAEIGANRLDAWARTPQGRNFLAHALVQLARTGWLRQEPGDGFEPMTDRPTVEPAPAVQAPAADRAALREQIAEAALRAVETAMDDTLLPAAREKALVGIAAVLPAPTDRTAVLREAADRYAKLTDENEAYDREHGQLDEVARIQHETVRDVVTGLRRMADEAQQDGARS